MSIINIILTFKQKTGYEENLFKRLSVAFMNCGKAREKTEHFEDSEKNIGAYAIKFLIIRIPLNFFFHFASSYKVQSAWQEGRYCKFWKGQEKSERSKYEKLFHVN